MRGSRDRRSTVGGGSSRRVGGRGTSRGGRIDPQGIEAGRIGNLATARDIMLCRTRRISKLSIFCDHGHGVVEASSRWTLVDKIKRMESELDANPRAGRIRLWAFDSGEGRCDRWRFNQESP